MWFAPLIRCSLLVACAPPVGMRGARAFSSLSAVDCIQDHGRAVLCAVSLPRPPSAYFRPQAHRREAPLVPRDSVLLFIDVQNYNCSRNGAVHAASGSQVCACPSTLPVTRAKLDLMSEVGTPHGAATFRRLPVSTGGARSPLRSRAGRSCAAAVGVPEWRSCIRCVLLRSLPLRPFCESAASETGYLECGDPVASSAVRSDMCMPGSSCGGVCARGGSAL